MDHNIAKALRMMELADPAGYREILEIIKKIEEAEGIGKARTSFIAFAKMMWPVFMVGRHHEIMGDLFEKVLDGKKDRVIINLAPRHGKSELASWLLPAWFLGKYPEKKIIQASNVNELATNFGRRVRNLVASEEYQKIFPGTELRADSHAAGRWETSAGGVYHALGVGSAAAGKGADLLIIDDPHALEISTEIPTPRGFVTIAELTVGDEVYGPDGLPTKVIGKSEVFSGRELYSVSTDDGAEILCDKAHLWNCRSDTKLSAGHRNYTTEKLASWSRKSAPCLPRHRGVEYPEADLSVEPWVLGAWLGDGTCGLGRMSSHPDDMPYMRGQFEAAGYKTTICADEYTFGVLGLRVQLRELGILDNKDIPEKYLVSSSAQRLSLLQGLMDTDGNITKTGQCSFNNCNRALTEGLAEIVRSLGVKASVKTIISRRPQEAPIYRCNFKMARAARMPRKAARAFSPTDKRCRSIAVRATGRLGTVQCITVDRSDGLFLAGRGYVVTHNSEQEAITAMGDPEVFNKVYDWYVTGPRQRLQPNAKIIVVQTRWAMNDLTGRLLKAEAQAAEDENVDRWELIELPAVLKSGEPLWPEFWTKSALERTKNALPAAQWAAQYLQQPTSEIGALIKREWWKRWEHETPPKCHLIMISGDLAFTKTERSNYSAFTTWGIFSTPGPNDKPVDNIILLDAWRDRMEFPELKRAVYSYYKEKKPDMFILENKVSGISLIQELRAIGIPVMAHTPTRGSASGGANDKVARVNSVADIFASGMVWAPLKHWADEVIEEVAAFPLGDHDDYTDTVSQAMMRFRQGGFVKLATDWDDEIQPLRRRVAAYY